MLSPLLILEIPWKAGCFVNEVVESRLRERAPEFKLSSGVVGLSGITSAVDDVSFSRLSCLSGRLSIGIGTGKIAGQTGKGKVGITG